MAENQDSNKPVENRQEIMEMLNRLDEQLQTLKVEFEQYFSGIVKFQPDKLKAEVERSFRKLLKAPLKNAQLNFKVRSLKYKYNTLDTYWRRVLREKEEGRYHKDLFKAEYRSQMKKQAERSKSRDGIADKQMQTIYDVYSRALRDSGFKAEEVSLEAFKNVVTQRANALKKANPGKKVKFSVVLKDGKPTVEASIKE